MKMIHRVRYLPVARGRAIGIDKYPNFSATGSVAGMRKIYGEDAYLLKCGSYIYNVPSNIYFMGK